jgi:cyd operon protein YbgT
MWYFTWVLGTGFAACFAVVNAMWYEAKNEQNSKRI